MFKFPCLLRVVPSRFSFFSLFFILLFNASLVLAAGERVNRTIDDTLGDSITGQKPLFLPSTPGVWAGASCAGCAIKPDPRLAFKGTWTAATYNKDLGNVSITIPFTGTDIYIFFILANNVGPGITTRTQCNFTLDDKHAGDFVHNPTTSTALQYNENAMVFKANGLKNTPHNLLISTSGVDDNVFINFDYAIYTSQNDTASSTAGSGTPTSTPEHSNGSVSSSRLPAGTVVAIIITVLAVIIAFVVGTFFFCRRRRRNEHQRHQAVDIVRPNLYLPSASASVRPASYNPFSPEIQSQFSGNGSQNQTLIPNRYTPNHTQPILPPPVVIEPRNTYRSTSVPRPISTSTTHLPNPYSDVASQSTHLPNPYSEVGSHLSYLSNPYSNSEQPHNPEPEPDRIRGFRLVSSAPSIIASTTSGDSQSTAANRRRQLEQQMLAIQREMRDLEEQEARADGSGYGYGSGSRLTVGAAAGTGGGRSRASISETGRTGLKEEIQAMRKQLEVMKNQIQASAEVVEPPPGYTRE